MNKNILKLFFVLTITILTISNSEVFIVKAESDVTQLRQQVETGNQEINRLEKEIAEYQQQLNQIGQQTKSLEGELNRFRLTTQKLNADIALTEQQIENTRLNITNLSNDIDSSAEKIEINKSGLASSIRAINEYDRINLLGVILSQDSLADFLQDLNALTEINNKINNLLAELRETKTSLETSKVKTEKEQAELLALQQKLDEQKKIALANQEEAAKLLEETKNEEASYNKILAQRLEKKRLIESEIRQAEEAIRVQIDPASLPSTAPGILQWPLANIRITQYFGNTNFATQNPQIYKGAGHNGIDLAASVGTPIKSVLAGQVIGTGDTDITCRGASYGRWILIEHPNGLSSLYAHLSLIKVKEGQSVSTGQEIAYGGNTGYTTGPHLHFSVFASAGVEVGSLQSQVPGCGIYRLPLAANNSVLNPLSYLPSI